MDIRSGTRPPSPVHFHHIDTSKSFLALQELQNEVGLLLEFRDVVMEAFPHLRGKLAASRGKWEPGVRVRKKLREGDLLPSSQPRSRSNSRSKGSASTSGTAVQDSGFCTQESKKTSGEEAEDELWNLLEVIHQRGTKLRIEVESLQERYSSTGPRRSRSLEDVSGEPGGTAVQPPGGPRPGDPVSRRLLLMSTAPGSLEELRTPPPGPVSPRLGNLDAVLSTPKSRIPCPKGITPDRQKTAAILRETNLVELQRHLITSSHEVQVVHHRLEKLVKNKTDLTLQLDKVKEENEDLKFRLEEKTIELEAARAMVRLLERPGEYSTAHCSSTESAHAVERSVKPRRSKIPLKAAAPKPPGPSSGVSSSNGGGRSLARSVVSLRPPSRSSSRESLGRPSPPHPTSRSSPRQLDHDKRNNCSIDSLDMKDNSRELDRSLRSTVGSRVWCAKSQFFDSIESRHDTSSQTDSLDKTDPDLV